MAMDSSLPSPRVRRTAQNTQYAYNLSRRIHDVKSYPVQTPQGANVLLYAHESGVTFLWRGGRRLKSPGRGGKQSSQQNGTSSTDAFMIIDSDDEESVPDDKPEFEEATVDDKSSFPGVIQTVDLSLGTAALHIAVLPLPPCTADAAASDTAAFLRERIVFAVACATGKTYIITLPLTPPSHQRKANILRGKDLLAAHAGKGAWGETVTILSGQSKHSDGLALALVAKQQKSTPDARRPSDPSTPEDTESLRVVVASHTREASGTLRFWDINLKLSSPSNNPIEPFQTEHLPTPLTAISFNPSQSTQLLAITSPHAVRVYDYSIPSLPDDISDGPFPAQGSWLLSLYPPFARGSVLSTARKPIVAADWIAHGRAVLALLADGQWGIWDIDGAHAPSASSTGASGLFTKHSPGLRGSALATFSATGYLEGTSPLRNPVSHKSPAVPGSGDFVPMTPHTRRDALTASIGGGVERLAAVKGGIAVLRAQPLRATAAPTGTEESAVLWIGGADPIVAVIPAVSRFWDAQLRRGVGGGVNLFSGAQPTRMIRLENLAAGLLGERCTGVEAAVRGSNRGRAPSDDPDRLDDMRRSGEGLPIEVLVQGESRLVVIRENDDGTPVTSRFPGLQKKKRITDRSTSAIIAYPRPEKPSSVAFNLSVSRPGNNLGRSTRQRPSVKGLFEPSADRLMPSTEPDTVANPQSRPIAGRGLAFAQSLAMAADASDNEKETEERDVEAEMLDIMEIDRELEEMEAERDSGRKHVFFEEG
ncbi:hypothetical protein GE09DRAFT_688201 [Coniochaeta sp. 2T2.1]|nr:hypothetical protein GE09DRAFT_688201 [Coniochaeta sp. 2T2.1]